MSAQKLAEIMDGLAGAIQDVAEQFRDLHYDNEGQVPVAGHEVQFEPDPAPAKVKAADGPDANAVVQISAGDLWKLINRSRKMIRFAREGKVPNLDQRMPLNLVIRAIKAQGLAKKPHNLD